MNVKGLSGEKLNSGIQTLSQLSAQFNAPAVEDVQKVQAQQEG